MAEIKSGFGEMTKCSENSRGEQFSPYFVLRAMAPHGNTSPIRRGFIILYLLQDIHSCGPS